MALEPDVKARLERALVVVDDHGVKGTRLIEDARRLCSRVGAMIKLGLVTPEPALQPPQVACYALQLPLKTIRMLPGGKLPRTSLRERAEQAVEILATLFPEPAHEPMLEATSQLLLAVHQKKPESELARLLSDALNMEDFGISGLVLQAVQVARQGGSVQSVADGCHKREAYGYWDARLKEGFHFEPVRQLARKRLETARKMASLLMAELREDGVD